MINIAPRTSRKTSNPIIFLYIWTFAFPFNHSIVITRIRATLQITFLGPFISEFRIRGAEPMKRFFITKFLLDLLINELHAIKGINRKWKRSICSRISSLQTSFPISRTFILMLFYPVFVCFSRLLCNIYLVMRIIYPRTWHCSWKKLRIFVEKSSWRTFFRFFFRCSICFFLKMILANSWCFMKFSFSLDLL